ncbi:MAG: hypothetical protein E3J65_00215 [Dehalococcoidia bacterium]|nr:MAG: hypothetical protein E3J65_00215 [Dehalococcoidia bacterium]
MTTPSREEIDAIWAELKDVRQYVDSLGGVLYANALHVAQQLAMGLIRELYSTGLMAFAVTPNPRLKAHRAAYVKYMEHKVDSAAESIRAAENIEAVLAVHRSFLDDLDKYMQSLL